MCEGFTPTPVSTLQAYYLLSCLFNYFCRSLLFRSARSVLFSYSPTAIDVSVSQSDRQDRIRRSLAGCGAVLDSSQVESVCDGNHRWRDDVGFAYVIGPEKEEVSLCPNHFRFRLTQVCAE